MVGLTSVGCHLISGTTIHFAPSAICVGCFLEIAPQTKELSYLQEATIKVNAKHISEIPYLISQLVGDQWIPIQLIPQFTITKPKLESESRFDQPRVNRLASDFQLLISKDREKILNPCHPHSLQPWSKHQMPFQSKKESQMGS